MQKFILVRSLMLYPPLLLPTVAVFTMHTLSSFSKNVFKKIGNPLEEIVLNKRPCSFHVLVSNTRKPHELF